MATRFYFDTSAPTVSPTPDGSWEVTGTMIRRWLDNAKRGAINGDHDYEALAVATALNSPAGAVDALILQAVSPALDSNQTISGAIKGQIRAQESNAAGDLRMQCVIWVMKSDGTSRGTLIATNASALASEFASAVSTNRKIPLGGSTVPTSVAAQTGDRIVVEIGYRKHESATTSRTGTFQSGNPALDGDGVATSDLPEDETTTTLRPGWIEFADNLTFTKANVRTTQVKQAVAYAPDSGKVRASAVKQAVAYTPDTGKVRASHVVMHVAVSGAVVVTRTPRSRVYWVD